MFKRLDHRFTIVLRVDRQPVLSFVDQIRALGYDPATAQALELQLPQSTTWRVWRVFPNVAPVDVVPALTPAELAALDVQPGIVGVWRER